MVTAHIFRVHNVDFPKAMPLTILSSPTSTNLISNSISSHLQVCITIYVLLHNEQAKPLIYPGFPTCLLTKTRLAILSCTASQTKHLVVFISAASGSSCDFIQNTPCTAREVCRHTDTVHNKHIFLKLDVFTHLCCGAA